MGRRGPVPPPTRSPYATLVALTRREPHGSFFSVGFDTQGGGGAVITATELATEEAAHLPLALNTVIYRGLLGGPLPLRCGGASAPYRALRPLRSVDKTLGHASYRPSSSG